MESKLFKKQTINISAIQMISGNSKDVNNKHVCFDFWEKIVMETATSHRMLNIVLWVIWILKYF